MKIEVCEIRFTTEVYNSLVSKDEGESFSKIQFNIFFFDSIRFMSNDICVGCILNLFRQFIPICHFRI